MIQSNNSDGLTQQQLMHKNKLLEAEVARLTAENRLLSGFAAGVQTLGRFLPSTTSHLEDEHAVALPGAGATNMTVVAQVTRQQLSKLPRKGRVGAGALKRKKERQYTTNAAKKAAKMAAKEEDAERKRLEQAGLTAAWMK